MLEKENEFVSREEHTEELKQLMEEVYFQLNDKHNAIVQVGRYTLNLKVVPNKPDPPPIHDWSVPVLLIDSTLGKEEWDLTTKEVAIFAVLVSLRYPFFTIFFSLMMNNYQ